VTIEDAALDSFQNVLFSIARFRELTGRYPARITVVGHDFKRRRFEDLHRLAIRWPKPRFTYEGVPLGSEADEREAAAGEVRLFIGIYLIGYILCVSFPNCPSVGQRVFSIFRGPVWLPRAPRPKTCGTEFAHANTWVPRRCPRTARVVRVVPKGWYTYFPWNTAVGKRVTY
jgi:hypothetical protein